MDKKCPIKKLEKIILSKIVSQKDLFELKKNINKRINKSMLLAEKSNFPKKELISKLTFA